jgi:Ca2+-binding EF-hand superfamily protein
MLLAPMLVLAATAAQPPAPPAPTASSAPAFVSHHGGRLFISPMGEPFRPNGRDDDGLADWFRQADRNHDGQLTLDEMQADADRFFALLDVNHDGEIDPDEITRYESVIAPEISSGSHFEMTSYANDAPESENSRRGGHGGHHRSGGESAGFFRGGEDQHQGAGRYGLLDLPEPVVSADTDFNRGVSRAEFQAAAAQRFLALDVDHKGYLTLPVLETIRPAPPAAPKAPEQPKIPDEDPLPSDTGPGL